MISRTKLCGALRTLGFFSVKSLYKQLFGGVSCRKMNRLWKNKMPLKVKIFMWLCYHNRVQTLDQIKKRGWKGNTKCMLCGLEENIAMFCFPVV